MLSLLLSLLLVQAPAQSASDAVVLPSAQPMGSGAAAYIVDGAPFAVGERYKAYFDARGFALHPALGEDAPRNLPFRYELESIARGGVPLALAPAEPVIVEPGLVPGASSARIEYDRGAVVERYDVHPGGLEQGFVFARRPSGPGVAGDLVVRGRVTTELVAAPGAATEAAPLRFLAEHGGVQVGGARAFDADGRAFDVGVRWDGASLELVLAHEAVEAARWPVVLDPMIGPLLSPGTGADSNADVAYSDGLDKYLVVFQRSYSFLDRDVYARRYVGDTGASVDAGPVPVDVAWLGSGQNPACAMTSGSDTFFIVWERGATGVFSPRDVVGVSMNTVVPPMLSPTKMLSAGTGKSQRPDVCGENSGFDGTGEALAVWEEAGAVGARAVTVAFPTGAVATPGNVVLFADGSYELARPVVPKRVSAGGIVALAFERREAGVLKGMVLRPTNLSAGFISSGSLLTTAGPPEADIACDGTFWMLVYQSDTAGVRNLFRWHATFDGLFFQVKGAKISADPAIDESNPSVVHAGTKWFVAYSRLVSGLDSDPYALGLATDTLALCEPPFALATTSTKHEDDLAVAGALGPPGLPNRHSMAVWTSSAVTPPFEPNVLGVRLAALGAGGPVTDLGGGCGAGGTLTVSGPVAVGNPGLEFKLAGGDVFAVAALLNVDPTPGPPIVCGTCTAVFPSILLSAAYAGGSASLTVPVPCQGGLVGVAVEAQWIVFPTVGSPCSLFPNLSISNRMQLVIGT